MSNFIYYENLEDYEKQVEKAKKFDDLNKENKELRRVYMKLAKRQEELGNHEMAGYMLAQIDAVPTFTVEDPPLEIDWEFRCELAISRIDVLLDIMKEQPLQVDEYNTWLKGSLCGIRNALWRGE